VFDYCFLGGKEDEDTLAVQVARFVTSKAIFAHPVSKKGMGHEHGAKEMIKDIAKVGHTEIILKCDGEPALKQVQEEVKARREQETTLENSPVGCSRSNGIAERAVQALGEQVRVMRSALRHRVGRVFSAGHPVTMWLVEHAADVMTKYQVGKDGKTAYERIKGKAYKKEMVEFGEVVHYRLGKRIGKMEKLEVRWGRGVFLGVIWRTGEALIGTSEEVVKASCVKRMSEESRWDGGRIEKIRGCRGIGRAVQ
jgi:hypothetical protein